MAVRRLRVPSVLRGIMPVVVIPLISSAVVGFLMFLLVVAADHGRPGERPGVTVAA
ncbi:hypothetical protein [Streptomyces sp. NPDC053079]|uniref:hypothetical protein n=1 Tax=Streptomyces sp. NPDC053079 TaxID=3365697 RepID=UPI0037D51F95